MPTDPTPGLTLAELDKLERQVAMICEDAPAPMLGGKMPAIFSLARRALTPDADLLAAAKVVMSGPPQDDPAVNNTGAYHTGLHCGVEDRDLQGRGYDAADYGFERGVERAFEWVHNTLRTAIASSPPSEGKPTTEETEARASADHEDYALLLRALTKDDTLLAAYRRSKNLDHNGVPVISTVVREMLRKEFAHPIASAAVQRAQGEKV